MTKAEAIGLTWDDVDMDKKEIDINHQVQYRKIQGIMKLYANDTKTNAGNRIIPMTVSVYHLLWNRKNLANDEKRS